MSIQDTDSTPEPEYEEDMYLEETYKIQLENQLEHLRSMKRSFTHFLILFIGSSSMALITLFMGQIFYTVLSLIMSRFCFKDLKETNKTIQIYRITEKLSKNILQK